MSCRDRPSTIAFTTSWCCEKFAACRGILTLSSGETSVPRLLPDQGWPVVARTSRFTIMHDAGIRLVIFN
jgi:hypothetical protein